MFANKKKMFLVLSIVWYIVILSLSAQTADISSNLSGGITESVIKIFEKINIFPQGAHLDIEFVDKFHTVIRKLAHMFEYFILSIFIFHYLYYSNVNGSKVIYLSIILTILAASGDEFFQTTIDGRAGQITDVLIDGVGGSIGVLLTKAFKSYKDK
jgi:VanZ family protein